MVAFEQVQVRQGQLGVPVHSRRVARLRVARRRSPRSAAVHAGNGSVHADAAVHRLRRGGAPGRPAVAGCAGLRRRLRCRAAPVARRGLSGRRGGAGARLGAAARAAGGLVVVALVPGRARLKRRPRCARPAACRAAESGSWQSPTGCSP